MPQENVSSETCRPWSNQPDYVLKMASQTLLAFGKLGALPAGPLATLADRVADYFASNREGPDLLVGVLPFDPEMSACLIQPARVVHIKGAYDLSQTFGSDEVGVDRITDISADPTPIMFMKAVADALSVIDRPHASVRKIVLSRSLKVAAMNHLHVGRLLRKLTADESVTVFMAPLPAKEGRDRVILGATPELLLEKNGTNIASHPLAGSAKRNREPNIDRQRAEALRSSAKDRQEHAIVVESILDVLSPFCRQLVAERMQPLSTSSMWHLGTRINGKLKDTGISATQLLALLHPTPAVCGSPRSAALELIRNLEFRPRDFYTGAVGWCDAAGDGRWYLSIRCAEIAGREARLYAGAGIVPGSTPAGELAETTAKFTAMLSAFGAEGETTCPDQQDFAEPTNIHVLRRCQNSGLLDHGTSENPTL